MYGLPKDVGPWSFVYNKDLFDEAGALPFRNGRGMDLGRHAGSDQKLTVDDNGDGKPDQYGVGAYSLESAVWGNGGEYIDYATGTVKVNEPEFYEAMQFVADLNLKHKVSPNQEAEQAMNAYTRFINGQLAMFAMGPWDQPAFWERFRLGHCGVAGKPEYGRNGDLARLDGICRFGEIQTPAGSVRLGGLPVPG